MAKEKSSDEYEVAYALLDPAEYMRWNMFRCDRCDFNVESTGGAVYVTTKRGKHKVCPHPSEGMVISQELGFKDLFELRSFPFKRVKDPTKRALIQERTGFWSHCLCPDCLKDFDLDWTRDDHKCPQCGSRRVGFVADLHGKPCPKCKQGTVIRKWTGVVS